MLYDAAKAKLTKTMEGIVKQQDVPIRIALSTVFRES